MLEIEFAAAGVGALAIPVVAAGDGQPSRATLSVGAQALVSAAGDDAAARSLVEQLAIYLTEQDKPEVAGSVNTLPRPGSAPNPVLLVGVGAGDVAGWRAAGAALTRACKQSTATVVLAADAIADTALLTAFAEGALLASYRFDLGEGADQRAIKLRRLVLATTEPVTPALGAALACARTTADAVCLARDLTNTPSAVKSPQWFADQVAAAAGDRLGVRVWDEPQLKVDGFGGILAVGGGSDNPPRLVELSWSPPGAKRHVVLVGKGITFDTGGISIKTIDGMKLMRKDMAGAAAVCAAAIGAARLGLPIRVTALAPLAANMISGASYRPSDVVHHYGGLTSEVHDTDAEGRVVLGDALAYVAANLSPDYLVDLATLTGAIMVALGKKTAALFSEDERLAAGLRAAAAATGERIWPMPLVEDYTALIAGDVADLDNAPESPGAGGIKAALYLREFTGSTRDHWAHLDMSAPAWSESADGLVSKGATGFGVRLLLRWLTDLAEEPRKAD